MRVGEHVLVAVGRRVDHRHLLARPRSSTPSQLGVRGGGAPEVVQRVGPAQDLLDRAGDERRVGPQRRPAGRGAASSASRPDDSIVLVVSLPAVTSCTKKLPKSMSVIGSPPNSRAEDQRREVLARRLRRGAAAANSMAYIAISIDAVVRVVGVAGEVGVLAARCSARPSAWMLRPVLLGEAHELADRPATAAATHTSCTKSTSPCSAASAMISRQIVADPVLEAGRSTLALKRRRERPAVVDVARRVHRQQHVAHHRPAARASRSSSTTPPSRRREQHRARGPRGRRRRAAAPPSSPVPSGMSCQWTGSVAAQLARSASCGGPGDVARRGRRCRHGPGAHRSDSTRVGTVAA